MGASREKYCCDVDYDRDIAPCLPPLILLISSIWGLLFGLSLLASSDNILNSPEPPIFQVESVNTTTPFTVDNLATTVKVGLNITFWVANPNKGAIYNRATVQVYYRSLLLSSSTPFNTLCPGVLSCKDMTQTWLLVDINVSSVPVFDTVIATAIMSDLRREKLSLNVKIVADYRDKGNVETPGDLRVDCNDVKIGVPTGVMIGDPKNCEVYWSRNLRTIERWLLALGYSVFFPLVLVMIGTCCGICFCLACAYYCG